MSTRIVLSPSCIRETMAIIIVSGGGHGDEMFRQFRPLYKGTLTANANVIRDRGNLQRLTEDGPLAEVDWETVYAPAPSGYSDSPAYQQSQPTHTNNHN